MKINFVFHTAKSIFAGYMGSSGLRQALEDNGLLNYAYDQTGDQFLDISLLQSTPIFYVRGFLVGRMPLVARGGNQFKACWQSESYFTRRGDLDSSTPMAIENAQHFNMMFTCAETDLDCYGIPTYFLPSWGDTNVFKPSTSNPQIVDKLGFYGGTQGREDFLEQDTGIIEHFRSKFYPDAKKTAEALNDEIGKYAMLVAPPGRCFTSMPGRAFEIMACRRMAFIYLNESTMFEHMKFFKDGVDCAYFRDWSELEDKFRYYCNHMDEVERISDSGYRKILSDHNQNVRAHYIVKCMRKEYKKWLKEQSMIPRELELIYEGL